MLLPIHVNCAKPKELKALNRISFFSTAEPIEGLGMRAAGSTKGTIHAVCPLLNIIGKANRKAAGTTSSASAPFKRSAFLSSYHHRQRRWKGSGTHALVNFRQHSNARRALIHNSRKMTTQGTITELGNLGFEFFLVYCMNMSRKHKKLIAVRLHSY